MNDFPVPNGIGGASNTYANMQPYDLSSLFSSSNTSNSNISNSNTSDSSSSNSSSSNSNTSDSSSSNSTEQFYPYKQEEYHLCKYHEEEHKDHHKHHDKDHHHKNDDKDHHHKYHDKDHHHKNDDKDHKHQHKKHKHIEYKDNVVTYHTVQEVERIKLSDHHLIKSESAIIPVTFHGLICDQNIIQFYLHRLGKIVYLRWNSFSGIIPAQHVEYLESKQAIPYTEDRQDFPIVLKQGKEDIVTFIQLHHVLRIKLHKTSCKDQYIIVHGSTIQWLCLV